MCNQFDLEKELDMGLARTRIEQLEAENKQLKKESEAKYNRLKKEYDKLSIDRKQLFVRSCALERIMAGEDVKQVIDDYGFKV